MGTWRAVYVSFFFWGVGEGDGMVYYDRYLGIREKLESNGV